VKFQRSDGGVNGGGFLPRSSAPRRLIQGSAIFSRRADHFDSLVLAEAEPVLAVVERLAGRRNPVEEQGERLVLAEREAGAGEHILARLLGHDRQAEVLADQKHALGRLRQVSEANLPPIRDRIVNDTVCYV
jgi:hypothetical protein